jgi:tRNA(Ile2) C34 agmatinyltransferase TiaS
MTSENQAPLCDCGAVMEPLGMLDYKCPVCDERLYAETQDHFDRRITDKESK